jgi:hypothetical protein
MALFQMLSLVDLTHKKRKRDYMNPQNMQVLAVVNPNGKNTEVATAD